MTTSTSTVARPAMWPRLLPQLGLLVLLVCEVLFLTIRFDTKYLDAVPTLSARLIGWSPEFLRILTTAAVVTLLVSGKRLWEVVRADQRMPAGDRIRHLLAHAVAFSLFFVATAQVMGRTFPLETHQNLWSLLWLASGVATVLSWSLACLPRSTWRIAWAHSRWAFLTGFIVGGIVFAGGFVARDFWKPLAGVTFSIVRWMLAPIYADAFSDPAALVLGTQRFSVHISPECSGYEGVGLILAFLSVYLYVSRASLRFPNALVLLPLGALAVWILNAVRIAMLIAIGTAGWPEVAQGGFHSQAGWLAFNAVGMALVAITIRGRYFLTSAQADSAALDDPQMTAAHLGPFLAVVVTSMVTGAMSAGFDWLYPVRVVSAGSVLWAFRKRYSEMRWSWSWEAIALGAVTAVIWIVLLPVSAHDKDAWPVTLSSINPAMAAAWMAIRVIGYVVTVPLAEELAFRGYLTRRLMGAGFQRVPAGEFSLASWLGSSVLFGAMHGSMWPAGTLAGLIFGLALYRRRALGDAVQAHATTNLLLVIYAATTGHWSAWS